MKSQVIVRDDRPFSSVKGQVPHFKGLKGQRTVTYRNSLYSDDLDDPELVFDNNNTFRDECIIRTFNCDIKDAIKGIPNISFKFMLIDLSSSLLN